jgi:hypothetical protein
MVSVLVEAYDAAFARQSFKVDPYVRQERAGRRMSLLIAYTGPDSVIRRIIRSRHLTQK